MNFDAIPVPGVFLASVLFVLVAAEAGYRSGRLALRRSAGEKDASVSAIGGAVLGLTAFILAFAFGIATDRFDMRKSLIREEANALRTAYARSDFLPEPERAEAKRLFRTYVAHRVRAVQSGDADSVVAAMAEGVRTQHRLWDMAAANAGRDLNSDVAALYLDALNEVINVHALRVAVAWQARIPAGVWLALFVLMGLGMFAMGYQMAIADSGRSWAMVLLAVSFSLVIALIAILDRPQTRFIPVSQKPLVDALRWMEDGPKGR
jgi:hypothetical protein